MNKTKYMQTDSRWGGLVYPRPPYFIRGCGCGEVSIANCIIEMPQFSTYTPATIQPYCKQYADPNGNGTYWSGIPAMMKHYGMTEVQEHATMTPLWKELAKGDRVAIYLMGSRKGGNKGVKWTSGGHFVCSVGYRLDEKTGKHWVYVKDSYSNSSLRNGWITYEDNMRNDVVKVWSGKLNIKKKKEDLPKTDYAPKTQYKGKLPTKTVKKGDKGEQVKRLKAFLKWRFNYSFTNDTFGKGTERCVKAFQQKYSKQYGLAVDGIFGSASLKCAKDIVKKYNEKYAPDPLQPWYDAMVTQFNWSKNQAYDFVTPTVASSKTKGTCITFPAVALQRLGIMPSGGYFYLYPKTMKIAGNSTGVNYVKDHPEIYAVSYPGKTIAQLGSNIKKGDIVGFGGSDYHTMVYMGKNASGQPIFNTMGHFKGLGVTYSNYANRKVDMLVRLKKVK